MHAGRMPFLRGPVGSCIGRSWAWRLSVRRHHISRGFRYLARIDITSLGVGDAFGDLARHTRVHLNTTVDTSSDDKATGARERGWYAQCTGVGARDGAAEGRADDGGTMRSSWKLGRTGLSWLVVLVACTSPSSSDSVGSHRLTVRSGEHVTVDGATLIGSSSGGYEWAQLDGPPIAIADSAAPSISFTAPLVGEATFMVFKLTIRSPEIDAVVLITITVLPPGSNADAGTPPPPASDAGNPEQEPDAGNPAPEPDAGNPTPESDAGQPPMPPPTGCDGSPGAGSDARRFGVTTYDGSGTVTISNVIFDGSHGDDLVRVYNGHVVFDHVTFRGRGTGSSGHTLEVKRGGSVEVRNSVFEGDPSEDSVQFEGNDPSVVRCSVFRSSPGEDHVDTKPGALVRFEDNAFDAPTPGGRTVQNHNGRGAVELVRNTGLRNVFYESGASGSIIGNEITGSLDLYDAENVLVEGNEIASVKHGEGSGSRDPVDTYFLNNTIDRAQNNGGSCFQEGSSGAVSFCRDGRPGWYSP